MRTSPRVPMGRLAHPWLFHDAPERIQEGRADPSDAQHVLHREETDRVLRSSWQRGPHGQSGRYKRVILSRFALIVPLNYGLRYCRALCIPPHPPLPSRHRRRPILQGWKGHYFRGDTVNASVHRARALLVTSRFCENAALDFLSSTMRPRGDILRTRHEARLGYESVDIKNARIKNTCLCEKNICIKRGFIELRCRFRMLMKRTGYYNHKSSSSLWRRTRLIAQLLRNFYSRQHRVIWNFLINASIIRH